MWPGTGVAKGCARRLTALGRVETTAGRDSRSGGTAKLKAGALRSLRPAEWVRWGKPCGNMGLGDSLRGRMGSGCHLPGLGGAEDVWAEVGARDGAVGGLLDLERKNRARLPAIRRDLIQVVRASRDCAGEL